MLTPTQVLHWHSTIVPDTQAHTYTFAFLQSGQHRELGMSHFGGTTDESGLPRAGGGAQGPVATQGGSPPSYGGPAPSPSGQRRDSAVVLLVVAVLSTVLGCVVALPAVILGILAVVNRAESPARSAKFTRWGWIAYAAAAALWVLAAVALMVIAGVAASGNN